MGSFIVVLIDNLLLPNAWLICGFYGCVCFDLRYGISMLLFVNWLTLCVFGVWFGIRWFVGLFWGQCVLNIWVLIWDLGINCFVDLNFPWGFGVVGLLFGWVGFR